MPDPILNTKTPDPEILMKIGTVASEWAWIEMLLAEMLAQFCDANHGAMYVITQNVSNATVTDWLRILTELRVEDGDTADIILDLLKQINDTRADRNVVVHGTWRGHNDPGFAWVQTVKWDRREVARDALWSVEDLNDLIDRITAIQLMLGNIGIQMGFLKTQAS